MESQVQPKPKLLFVITQGELGGAQRYVYDLIANLGQNFSMIVAIGESQGRHDLQDKIKKLENQKIEIVNLRHLVRKISPIRDILAIFELAKLYKKFKPNIVHLNSSKTGILGSLAKLTTYNLKLKIVYTVHGWVFNEPLGAIRKTLYCWLEKFTSRWKEKIIVLSDFDFQTGQKIGIPTSKLIKIPLGIDTPQFIGKDEAKEKMANIFNKKDSSTTFYFSRNDTTIVTIANLYKTKGIDTLIEAIHILNIKYQISNIKFFIIGEGPERKNLENLIKKYQLEPMIHLLGAIDNVAQYLPAFDLFVLPSRKEGLPYTILEAINANLPIVATDVGGIKEILEDVVPPENPRVLAEKIIQTIKNFPHQQKNISSLEEMLKKTTAVYFKMVATTLSP